MNSLELFKTPLHEYYKQIVDSAPHSISTNVKYHFDEDIIFKVQPKTTIDIKQPLHKMNSKKQNNTKDNVRVTEKSNYSPFQPFFMKPNSHSSMLVVHNILNYGLGNKAALANKFRGKLSDYKHDSTVPLNLKSFNCHEYSTPYQCNKGLLQLIQLNFSSYRNDNNYDENHINDILLKLPQLHPNVNNIIICLNNIDTPYLKDNHKLFLRKLPQIIPFCTNSRFILNTNSIDGTFLFTLSELIHMRMIINRCKGEQWTSSTKWFSPYKVKELNQKKRSRKDRLFESFRMLVMKQKQICLVLSDSEGLSFPFLLDECRKRDILTTHSELTSHLKKLQERSLIDLGARGYQLKIDPSVVVQFFSQN